MRIFMRGKWTRGNSFKLWKKWLSSPGTEKDQKLAKSCEIKTKLVFLDFITKRLKEIEMR